MPTVLIIEDDPNVCKFITVNLSQRGYRTLTATNGEDGLAQARAEQPDLILLDLKLPGADGWATLETLRADPDLLGIPVVIITASAVKEEERRARQLGAMSYLVKPISVQQLVTTVRAALGERE
ncbi:MAG TPA: response regulator [Anaerolineae bacterium]|nr:response regulator [Anaerolineae bacterium]